MKKRRLFFDMDGVLATFHPEKSIEEISEPGYFENLEPMQCVVNAVKELCKMNDIYILSSILNDECAVEKRKWLNKFLPCINSERMLFVPYGTDKSDYVREITGEIITDDILVDDFTYNLVKWHGVGIKLLNKINNTNRTWTGFIVNGNADSNIIYYSISGICAIA